MNIQLRALHPDDAPVLAQLANNRKIWNNVRDRMPFPYTEKDARTFIANVANKAGAQVQAIVSEPLGFVGAIGLHTGEDIYVGTAELAYWIGEPHWGKGLASEAVRQMIESGFLKQRLRRIFAKVYAFNYGSARVLEKNGFRQESVARAAILKNGKVWDEIGFALLQSEYQRAAVRMPQARHELH